MASKLRIVAGMAPSLGTRAFYRAYEIPVRTTFTQAGLSALFFASSTVPQPSKFAGFFPTMWKSFEGISAAHGRTIFGHNGLPVAREVFDLALRKNRQPEAWPTASVPPPVLKDSHG